MSLRGEVEVAAQQPVSRRFFSNASEDHVMKYLVDHLHLTALFHRGDLTEEEAINLDSYYRLHPLPGPRFSRRHWVAIPASESGLDVCAAVCDLPVEACDRETFERRCLASNLYRSSGVREDFVVIPVARSAHPVPEGVADSKLWQGSAACGGAEASVFFSPEGERGHARSLRELRAQRICLNCLVLAQCRECALSGGELYGTWGGMTEADRKRNAGRRNDDEHRLSHHAQVLL
ncbi:putative transcriptional regulator WhiB3 [Rhodococcus erythropolis]|jgi:hypothetical protein|nr:hypothetical protein [Rhodococcus erythropolis]OFV75514.1 putative transcriptional regulator WhiB3 [Rhodococcus erythropolis]